MRRLFRFCMKKDVVLRQSPICGCSVAEKTVVSRSFSSKYSPTRAGDNAVEFLQEFNGYLMCDGYSGYNKVSNAKRTACWAHIRRYLTDAIPKGKQLRLYPAFRTGHDVYQSALSSGRCH